MSLICWPMRRSLKLVRLLRRLGTKKGKSRRLFSGKKHKKKDFQKEERVLSEWAILQSGRGMRPVRRSLKLDQVYKVDEDRDKVLRNVSYMRPYAPLSETG